MPRPTPPQWKQKQQHALSLISHAYQRSPTSPSQRRGLNSTRTSQSEAMALFLHTQTTPFKKSEKRTKICTYIHTHTPRHTQSRIRSSSILEPPLTLDSDSDCSSKSSYFYSSYSSDSSHAGGDKAAPNPTLKPTDRPTALPTYRPTLYLPWRCAFVPPATGFRELRVID